MILLLAQLIAPPLQNSPVRLPGPDAIEQRAPFDENEPLIETPAKEESPTAPTQTPSSRSPSRPLPKISGEVRYSQRELTKVLTNCLIIGDSEERLKACASALTARLAADGFINSVASVRGDGSNGYIEIQEGRLAEIRVNSTDTRLKKRTERLLKFLQGKVLNLNELQKDLLLLKRVNGVGSINASLSRLGDDPIEAVLTLNITPGKRPWQGELALRNDGSPGSGEFRGNATLVKSDLALSGDTLLLYGETSWTDDPTIGQVIGSISYTVPLADKLTFSGSFGYTRNESPELDTTDLDISSDQYQGLGQFDFIFSETLRQRWSAFAGVSFNSNNLRLNITGGPDPTLTQKTSYLRVGIAGNGLSGSVAWSGNIYLLQALSTDFIDAGSANAIGGFVSAGWSFAPNLQLSGRLGGQHSFYRLPTSMYFSIGSDVGIRGLPGQLISGENGWLGTLELAWSFWGNRTNTLQFVPFIGAGGINTALEQGSFNDTVGSGGILARWLAGQNWAVELGYVHQFNTNNNLGVWNDWILDDGLYAKVQFRF